MTEDDFVTDQGEVTTTGEQNPIAARWAEAMNRTTKSCPPRSRFRAVAKPDGPVRRGCLDRQEQLLERAGCELPILTGENGDFLPESWNPPKSVASQCSVIKRGSDYIITASGGVQINAYRYASQAETVAEVGELREKTAPRPIAGGGTNCDDG